jgi:hypothetical protein
LTGTINLGTDAANYIAVTGSATNPTFTATGSSANINLVFTCKGDATNQFVAANTVGDAASLRNTSVTGYSTFAFFDSSNVNKGAIGYGNSSASVAPGGMVYFGASAVYHTWYAGASQRMTLSASGGLSIGTTTDAGATNLLVAGTITTSSSLNLPKTITAGGTTGAQTINKPSGSVNFAAAATSLVVTNSLCTTSSVINVTIATNDTTATGIRVVAAAGSFTIYMLTAPTSECRVNFLLTN